MTTVGTKTLISVLLLIAVSAADAAVIDETFALKNVRIVEVKTGRLIPNAVVVIAGNKISAAGPARSVPIPKNTRVVDASGRYAIPGLWDMHVHLVHQASLGLFIANGVTGIRDMGGAAAGPPNGCESIDIGTLLRWRESITAGKIGPRMFLSGPTVSNTGWPTSLNIDSPAKARDAVARLKAVGADFAKIYEKIPSDTYIEFAKEARRAGLTFAGHVPTETVSLAEAADAGQRSVEHIRDPLLMCFTPHRKELFRFFREDIWSSTDIEWGVSQFEKCPITIQALRRNKTWLVPTLVVESAKVSVDDDAFVEKRMSELMPESARAAYGEYVKKKKSQTPVERASEHLWWKTQLRLVDRMRRENVGFLAGTDSSCEGGLPGASLHEELELLVKAGFTELEALQTATINPAEYFGKLSDFGSIENGRLADLVLLNRHPLEKIENIRDIFAVIAGGRYFSKDELEDLKAVARRSAR